MRAGVRRVEGPEFTGLPDGEQHTGERRTERGKKPECRQHAAERRPTLREQDVGAGTNARESDERQLHEKGREIRARLVGNVDREQVPDSGDHEQRECRPRDQLETAGDGTCGVSATDATDNRNERRERDLPADPNRRAEDVQEQPDRRRVYGQHDAGGYDDSGADNARCRKYCRSGPFVPSQAAAARKRLHA